MLFDYIGFLEGLPAEARLCAVCGSDELEVDPNPYQMRAVGLQGNPGAPSGPIQLCAMVVCRRCYAIRLHATRIADEGPPAGDQ